MGLQKFITMKKVVQSNLKEVKSFTSEFYEYHIKLTSDGTSLNQSILE